MHLERNGSLRNAPPPPRAVPRWCESQRKFQIDATTPNALRRSLGRRCRHEQPNARAELHECLGEQHRRTRSTANLPYFSSENVHEWRCEIVYVFRHERPPRQPTPLSITKARASSSVGIATAGYKIQSTIASFPLAKIAWMCRPL